MRQDVVNEFRKHPYQAMKNYVKLSALVALSGATMGEFKDWVFDKKETSFSDKVVSNFLSMYLLSKYDIGSIQKDGVDGFVAKKIMPPMRWIADIAKDATNKDDEAYATSVRNIPIIGDFWYSQTAGKQAKEKAVKKDMRKPENVIESIKKLPADQREAKWKQLKKQDPSLASSVERYSKDKKLGVTESEKKFRNLNVYDMERAKAINKYIMEQRMENRSKTYMKLKEAGIISEKVEQQIVALRKKT